MNILIVEDEPVIGSTIHRWIQLAAPSATVELVTSLAAALVAVERMRPRLILTDLHVSDTKRDSVTAVEGLRAIAPTAHIMVISSQDDADIRMRARAAGADAYIIKASDTDEFEADLLAAIARVVAPMPAQ